MLNWYNTFFIVYSLIHLIILLLLISKPYLFYSILIPTIIATSTISLYQRQFGGVYSLCVILLAIAVLLLNNKIKLAKKPAKSWDTIHQWAFLLMSGYLMIQALRGITFYANQGTNYWVIYGWLIYFAAVGLLAFILTHNNLPRLNRNKLSFIITISTLLFLICYIIGGFFVEKVLHRPGALPRDLQHLLTTDTTQIAFLLIIAFPAAIFLFKVKNSKRAHKIIALLLFTTAFIYAYYWCSRFAVLIIICFIVVGLFTLSFRKILWFLLIPLLVLILNFQFIASMPKNIGLDIITMLQGRIDRAGSITTSFALINKNTTSILFGYGTNSYKSKLSTSFAPGLAVVLIDIGLIGLLFFVINFVLVARRICIQKNNPGKTVLLLSLMLTGAFMLTGQSLTNALFYFMIMPNGLLIQLCASSQEQTGDALHCSSSN